MRRSRSGRPKVSSTSTRGTVPGRVAGVLTPAVSDTVDAAMPVLVVLLVVTAVWGVHVRPGEGRRRDLPALRVPRGALRDRERRRSPIPGAGGSAARPRRRLARRRSPAPCSAPATRSRPPGSSGRPSPRTGFITGMYVVLHAAARARRLPARTSAAARGSACCSRPSGSRCSPASTAARSPATCSCSPARPSTRSRSC